MWYKVIYFMITLVIFLFLDFAWIGMIAKKFYNKHLGFLMRKKPNWSAAIVFYLLYVLGIMVFVLTPAISQESALYALSYGALFGLIAYATYDLTNLATTKDWPIGLTIVDMIWGSLLTAMTGFFSYQIISLIG